MMSPSVVPVSILTSYDWDEIKPSLPEQFTVAWVICIVLYLTHLYSFRHALISLPFTLLLLWCSIWISHLDETPLISGQESTNWTRPRTGSRKLPGHIITWMIDVTIDTGQISCILCCSKCRYSTLFQPAWVLTGFF
jgi:hypothetical protein